MLTARTEAEAYVEAAAAHRDVAYRCRGCAVAVVLKAGRIRIAHFAHTPDAGCAFGAWMSPEHLAAQHALATALRERGVVAELEAWLPGLSQDRRIDVLAHPRGRPQHRIALEVQRVDLSAQEIQARTLHYQAQAVAPLWLRLLDFGRLSSQLAMPRRGGVFIPSYAPRAWERWAHDHLLSRLWFWDSGAGRLWRGQFVPGFSRRVGDGFGPVWTPLFRTCGLALEGPFEPSDLRLQRGLVPQACGEPVLAGWFVAPGDPIKPAHLSPSVRPHLAGRDRLEIDGVDSLAAGQWAREPLEPAPTTWRTKPVLPNPGARELHESAIWAVETDDLLFLLGA